MLENTSPKTNISPINLSISPNSINQFPPESTTAPKKVQFCLEKIRNANDTSPTQKQVAEFQFWKANNPYTNKPDFYRSQK